MSVAQKVDAQGVDCAEPVHAAPGEQVPVVHAWISESLLTKTRNWTSMERQRLVASSRIFASHHSVYLIISILAQANTVPGAEASLMH